MKPQRFVGLATALLVAIKLVIEISATPAMAQKLDLERGLRNYLSIMNGTKKLEQLSQQEKLELFIAIENS